MADNEGNTPLDDMADNEGNTPLDGNHFESPNGLDFELAGWRPGGGDWHDVEKGSPLPHGKEWQEIDLVTINLAPDSAEGFYRSFEIIEGFDDLYSLGDLADEAADAYGFAAQ